MSLSPDNCWGWRYILVITELEADGRGFADLVGDFHAKEARGLPEGHPQAALCSPHRHRIIPCPLHTKPAGKYQAGSAVDPRLGANI